MDDFDIERCTRELESLNSLQICLTGYEANALIIATQILLASSLMNDKDIAPVLHCAEIAALKLQKLFVSCPVTFSTIERGWQLGHSGNFPAEEFPPEGFIL
jgi:hypothetical protein